MLFKITGKILEKETGQPLFGLIVQVRDQDTSFDNCLGAVTTDREGRFAFTYPEQEFRELFEAQPKIFLTVFAPPHRHLLDTKQKIRWGESAHANFDIVISKKKIGEATTKPMVNQVQGSLSLSSRQLKIDVVDGWHVPHLPGFDNGSRYGSPSILEQIQYVLLPIGACVGQVEIIPGPVVRKGRNIKPLPVQPVNIDIPEETLDETPSDVGAPPRKFIAPDPRYYRDKKPYPEKLVELGYAEEWEGVQRMRVRVRPLQFDPVSRVYLFYPRLRYIVHYEPASTHEISPMEPMMLSGQFHVSQSLIDILDQNRVHAYQGAYIDQFAKPDILEVQNIPTPIYVEMPYLIITDDYEWCETEPGTNDPTIPPTAPQGSSLETAEDGSIVKHFWRLARWKRQRGMLSKVVTVREIIENKNGVFGNLQKRRNVSAQDLQEVIRNFIWWAYKNWGVRYVLLGGDTNIIPMRKLVGYVTSQGSLSGWDCMRVQNEPIAEQQCKYYPDNHITKVYYCGPNNITQLPLLTQQSGKVIPYDQNRSGNTYPRWFCVSNSDFSKNGNWSPQPTAPSYDCPNKANRKHYFVIVEDDGTHLTDINDDYYWVSDDRKIPTDRYYACASSPNNMQPNERDFDKNGNLFSGQFRWDDEVGDEVPIDGFKIGTDVYIGRAPVRTPADARVFVDKVLSYELLRKIGTAPEMNRSYLKKIVHLANYSSVTKYKVSCGSDVIPSLNKATYDSSKKRARIKIDKDILDGDGEPKFNLILAVDTEHDLLVTGPLAGSSSLHWKFMTQDYNQVSTNGTSYIQVEHLTISNVENWDNVEFYWDPVGFDDRFHKHAETLRNEMVEWYPEFTDHKRIYRDCFDESEGPEIKPLNTDELENMLNEGCHFLAAMAHGTQAGFRGMKANNFLGENQSQIGLYIVYASSCSTAKPDRDGADRSLGEATVLQKGGGAVAYVGAARMDGTEEKARWFWDNLRHTRRLGRTSAYCELYDGIDQFYYKYNRILYGDPEMPVWVEMPHRYLVTCPESVARGDEIVVKVKDSTSRSPLKNHLVTFVEGWDPEDTDVAWASISKKTDDKGEVRYKIPSGLQATSMDVTICACEHAAVPLRYNYQPVTRTLEITP